MSPQTKRASPGSSPPPPPLPQQQASADLKQRIISSLNKLSDRDTQAIATVELEAIAKSLSQDNFSTFLNCLHQTDPNAKPTVRRQVVHLLSTLSSSHGCDALAPHLPKLISTLTRRLRDPDSAVRSACVSAAAALSSAAAPSPLLLRSLLDVLTTEQDSNSQIGAAMCLAAAVEAAPEVDRELLRKALPRLGKLVRSDGFRPKGAVLGLIGSVVGVGGASGKGALDWVVPCLVGFLSSADWMARKAAAEALGRVAVREKELAKEFRSGCLVSLENRRFDKVKVVRETMNRTLNFWKEVPNVSEETPPLPSQARAPVTDNSNSVGASPLSATKSSHDVGFKTPQKKKTVPANRSPPSDASCVTTSRKQSIIKCNDKNSTPVSHLDQENHKASTCKIDVSGLTEPSLSNGTETHDSEDPQVRGDEDHENPKPETKRILFSSMRIEKLHKFGGFRSGSRVVPYVDDGICYDKDIQFGHPTEEHYDDHKDFEDLSLIREQLIQIESQQSNLLNLLQRFIGKSQSGINSLETRVDGLEMALNEISYDLALSSGRIQHTDSADNTCCKLPGTEFLSPKFWRRTEGRHCPSKFLATGNMQDARISTNPDPLTETYVCFGQRFNHRARYEPFVQPSTGVPYKVRARAGFSSQVSADLANDDLQVCNARGIGKSHPLHV